MTTILVATVGLTVLISEGLDRGGDSTDQVVANTDTTTSSTASTTTTTNLPEGAATVTGTVTAVHLDGAVLDPRAVPAPFTITADRGFGNGGRLAGVMVDGSPATIEWDAGRPFVLSSGGALVLDPVRVDLVPEGLRVGLANAVHDLTPGTYQLDTPVAVGTSGVASARESVTFDAVDGSTFEGRGDAGLVLAPGQARRFLGPGTMHLEGTLELTDGSEHRALSRLDAAEGAYDVTLTPVPGGGWTVEARVDGAITGT